MTDFGAAFLLLQQTEQDMWRAQRRNYSAGTPLPPRGQESYCLPEVSSEIELDYPPVPLVIAVAVGVALSVLLFAVLVMENLL